MNGPKNTNFQDRLSALVLLNRFEHILNLNLVWGSRLVAFTLVEFPQLEAADSKDLLCVQENFLDEISLKKTR